MGESNFVGCIVGLAVGDAIGYPAEFRRRIQLFDEIGPNGIEDFIALKDPRFSGPMFSGEAKHPPGTFTDDTQMTIAVAEALLEAGESEPGQLAKVMGQRFVDWSQSLENDRAPGSTCMGVRVLAWSRFLPSGEATLRSPGTFMSSVLDSGRPDSSVAGELPMNADSRDTDQRVSAVLQTGVTSSQIVL